MRTIRCSGGRGVSAQGRCMPRGVYAWGGVSTQEDVCSGAGVCLGRGCTPAPRPTVNKRVVRIVLMCVPVALCFIWRCSQPNGFSLQNTLRIWPRIEPRLLALLSATPIITIECLLSVCENYNWILFMHRWFFILKKKQINFVFFTKVSARTSGNFGHAGRKNLKATARRAMISSWRLSPIAEKLAAVVPMIQILVRRTMIEFALNLITIIIDAPSITLKLKTIRI